MSLRKVSGFILIVLISVFLAGQEKPGTPEKSPEVLTSGTQLVLVPVVVTKDGKAVAGLSKESFSVLENGKPRTIASFEVIEGTPDAVKPKPAEGVWTNLPTRDRGIAKRLTIIVLDALNTPAMDQTYGRLELVKYLQQGLQPEELVALIIINRQGMKLIHDFTTDTQVLIDAVRKVKSTFEHPDAQVTGAEATLGSEGNIQAAAAQGSNSAVEAALMLQMLRGQNRVERVAQESVVRTTLNRFLEIAQAYSGVPGRKSLIWVTAGFPFTIGDPAKLEHHHMFAAIQQTFDALNHANIAVYPVDAAGLRAPSQERVDISQTAAEGAPRLGTAADAEWARQQISFISPKNETMRQMAIMTGGKVFYNTNDLKAAFMEASLDSSTYYLIGYTLPREDTATGWRKLEVKVKGGYRVRARNGFFRGAASEAPSASDLRQAVASPFDYTGVPFSVTWEPQPAGSARSVYRIMLASKGVKLQPADARMSLTIGVVIRRPDGSLVNTIGKDVDANLTSEQVTQLNTTGFTYRDAFPAAAGEYMVRFVVRDNIGRQIGSVTAPLKVL